ncbi:hypothetical protein GCM10009654_56400 [Streptomyces hebeiensis]|uniref:Transposase n=1 Tax=Streptomyces hebeiensis TaxID=229486 RepID=A0ABN1V376_9ACTN
MRELRSSVVAGKSDGQGWRVLEGKRHGSADDGASYRSTWCVRAGHGRSSSGGADRGPAGRGGGCDGTELCDAPLAVDCPRRKNAEAVRKLGPDPAPVNPLAESFSGRPTETGGGT